MSNRQRRTKEKRRRHAGAPSKRIRAATISGSLAATAAIGFAASAGSASAAGPFDAALVKDIHPGGSNSTYYTSFANLNGTLLFQANDGTNGYELWRSDGTAAGTTMVKDINPGAGNSMYSNPQPDMTVLGNNVFFVANDGTHGYELWKSDGTQAGTQIVKDINTTPGISASSNPFDLTAVGSELFFNANDGTHGNELWKSDGTPAGTVLVKDINSTGSNSSDPANLTAFGSDLLFTAHDGTNSELWTSDGTSTGTTLVKNINSGTTGQIIGISRAVNGKVLLSANDGTHGFEPWVSDGTATGTTLLKNINTTGTGGVNPSFPTDFTVFGSDVFFGAWDGTVRGLWKSDGTTAGTGLVAALYTTSSFATGDPSGLTVFGNELLFSANDGSHGYELWKSDGTTGGTTMLEDINPGGSTSSSVPRQLTVLGSNVFFSAKDATHGYELWKTDGTNAGTGLVKDINPGAANSYPSYLTAVGGNLFFSANDGTHGIELWKAFIPPPSVSKSGTSSSSFQLGAVKKKKHKGIAFQDVTVPGAGELKLDGAGLAPIDESVSAGTTDLKIAPSKKGKAGRRLRDRLNHKHKAKVSPTITFTPTGGGAASQTEHLKLIKKP